MKVLAILQARVSSTRLPGKVLKPILGKAMILRQLERIERAQLIEKVIVATSEEPSDDELCVLLESNHISYYRGSLDDVLDRFYKAAEEYKPEHVVRLTGDCPLIDPRVIDQVIRCHLETGSDYTCNSLTPTYPDGLDTEIMRFSVLSRAWKEAGLLSQREHVTPYINRNPSLFKIEEVRSGTDLSFLRWTVDEPEDFELAQRVYEALYSNKNSFGLDDILELLEKRPELNQVNSSFSRNEGYEKSLAADKQR